VTGCEDIRHELGAYALNALPDDEGARVREHLARCDACRDEHARLAGLRPLLDLAAPGAERPAIEQPSPLLEDAVLAGFAAERGGGGRRRAPGRRLALPSLRVALPSAALGAVVAIVALAAAGALNGDADRSSNMTIELTGAAGSAHAVLASAEAGTVIDLEARLPPSAGRDHYEVWMTSGDYRITAGSFRVGQDGRVSVELACGGPLDAYDGIEVTRGETRVLSAQL
jgi:anti-sigma factor RsiW